MQPISNPMYDRWLHVSVHIWTISKTHLPEKRPRYYAKSPLRRTCFSQYQASSWYTLYVRVCVFITLRRWYSPQCMLMSLCFTEWLWWQFQSDWIQHYSCTNCTVQTVSPLLMTHSWGSGVETSVFSTCSGWPPHYKGLTMTQTTINQSEEQLCAVLYIILQYILHKRERQSDGGSPLTLAERHSHVVASYPGSSQQVITYHFLSLFTWFCYSCLHFHKLNIVWGALYASCGGDWVGNYY